MLVDILLADKILHYVGIQLLVVYNGSRIKGDRKAWKGFGEINVKIQKSGWSVRYSGDCELMDSWVES